MKLTFALVALIGAVTAGPNLNGTRYGGKLGDDPKFLQYCSKYNKNVRDSRTFAKKQARYHTNDTIIADHNRKNAHNHDPNTLVLGHNWTSDMEPEDYLGMLGLKSNSHNSIRDDRGDRYSSYRGIDVATTVDHWNDGYVLPIKDQGNCGSCWSFAAVTSFEGTIAKKYNRSPVRLSEQSLVDCTLTTNSANRDRFGKDYGMWGCQGGLLPPAWEFIKDNGIMTNEDYPYFSGTTGSEGECKHVDSKVVPERPTGWGMFTPSNTITEVKAKVAKQPMSVSLDASREAFQFYSSGVIPASADCGEQLNHAIVVVGYTDDEGAPDPSPNPDPSPGPSPDPSPNPDPEPPTPTPSGNCKVTKWWHTCDEAPARRRNLQDASGLNNYWLMMNQWGTGWGDEGFVRFEISGGIGACGINKEIEWADL